MMYLLKITCTRKYPLSVFYKFLKQYASITELNSLKCINGVLTFTLTERIVRHVFMRFPEYKPTLLTSLNETD